MSAEGNEPTEALVIQRIRNRVIEALELCLPEGQAKLEAEAPYVYPPYEVINSWEDWVTSPRPAHFTTPPFTAEEVAAIAVFHKVWERVAGELPKNFPSYEEVRRQPYWLELALAAKNALAAFEIRGRLPEDRVAG